MMEFTPESGRCHPVYSVFLQTIDRWNSKYLVANATLLDFYSQIGIETSTFIYSNFAWGLYSGVEVKWSSGLLV
jgi:hypothetical protein